MGITYSDHLIDIGANDITPEQEREIEEMNDLLNANEDSHREAVATATSLRTLLAEAGEALWRCSYDMRVHRIFVTSHEKAFSSEVYDGAIRSADETYASIQSALRDASPTTEKPE